MSLITMASRAAPVFSRAFIGLAIAAAAGVGLSQTLAAEPNLGSGSVFTANEGGGSLSRIDLESGKVQSVTLPLMPHNVDVSAQAGFVFVVGAGQAGEMSMSGQGTGS